MQFCLHPTNFWPDALLLPAKTSPAASIRATSPAKSEASSWHVSTRDAAMRWSKQYRISVATSIHALLSQLMGVYRRPASPPQGMSRPPLACCLRVMPSMKLMLWPSMLRAWLMARASIAPPPTVPQTRPSWDTSICDPVLRGVEPSLSATVTSTRSQPVVAASSMCCAISRIANSLTALQDERTCRTGAGWLPPLPRQRPGLCRIPAGSTRRHRAGPHRRTSGPPWLGRRRRAGLAARP